MQANRNALYLWAAHVLLVSVYFQLTHFIHKEIMRDITVCYIVKISGALTLRKQPEEKKEEKQEG